MDSFLKSITRFDHDRLFLLNTWQDHSIFLLSPHTINPGFTVSVPCRRGRHHSTAVACSPAGASSPCISTLSLICTGFVYTACPGISSCWILPKQCPHLILQILACRPFSLSHQNPFPRLRCETFLKLISSHRCVIIMILHYGCKTRWLCQLHRLAPNYWYRPETADCTISEMCVTDHRRVSLNHPRVAKLYHVM